MPKRVGEVHRIVATVSIKIQSVGGFRVKVVKGVGRDPSAPSGVVIPGLHPVKSCFGVKVVSTVSYLATICKTCITAHRAVAVGIILERHQLCSCTVVHTNHVTFNYSTTPQLALQDKRNCLLSRVVFVVDFPEKIVRKKNYFSALLRGLFCCFLAE